VCLLHRPTHVALAIALVLLGRCGGTGQVSLAKLATNQDAYLGKQVSTRGTVEAQSNPNGSRYYVLADAEQDLVILVPNGTARRFAGHEVAVRGRFGFDPHVGRLIRITQISARR